MAADNIEHPLRICMICDFFYPRIGGVEMHIWSLAQCLLLRGHKVIVITHQYGDRAGVRYMTNGLKVYYTPFQPFHEGDTISTYYATFPLFRKIMIREQIDIVHCHQASAMSIHEHIMHAKTMGYKVVYTDHSLFGFADGSSINLNKLLKFTLSVVDHFIAVSHTCRENLVLRACLDPYSVSAIPNAVDANKFTPDPSKRDPKDTVNIVVMSRLAYRKGIDLLVEVIPEICDKFPQAYFIIGGDGTKRLLLEEIIEKNQLHDRVELLGAVPHSQVRDVLIRGNIFLNTSLTEAFCIAILEAACCGLYVVSTKVGGVPEVLPENMISLAEPTASGIIDALSDAIPFVKQIVPSEFHEEIRHRYSWDYVAERTEIVYRNVMKLPTLPLLERLKKYYGTGLLFGKLCCVIVIIDYLFWCIVEWLSPAHRIELAVDMPLLKRKKSQKSL